MAVVSKIEWTNTTWNPVTGCTKISSGCRNCYAERLALRLQAMGNPSYANGFRLTLHENLLRMPLVWSTPRLIFVNSMSDLFHEDVPVKFIEKVFHVMSKASHHQFQLLTKRSARLLDLHERLPWPRNVWMGVSVENASCIHRIEALKRTKAYRKFLSCEPLLGPLQNMRLNGIDWIIVGGESGPGARMVAHSWVADIRDQATRSRIPFFFKQWGGTNKKKSGRLLDGRTWDEFPQTGNHSM